MASTADWCKSQATLCRATAKASDSKGYKAKCPWW